MYEIVKEKDSNIATAKKALMKACDKSPRSIESREARTAGVANRRSESEQSPLRIRWPRAVLSFLSGAAGAQMGVRALTWEESIRGDRFALSKNEALAWLNDQTWSVIDAACLLNAITNDGECVSLGQLESGTEFICKQILEHVEDESPLREINKVFSLYGNKTKVRGECRITPWDNLDGMRFPVRAYFNFAMEELFPQEKSGYDLPCFGIFHDLDRETLNQDAIEPLEPQFAEALAGLGCEHPLLGTGFMPQEYVSSAEQLPTLQDQTEQPRGATAEQEIIEGLTVADVLKLFDKNHPRYRPELRAAVELWTSFEAKPLPDGFSPMQEIRIRLADWEVEHNCELKESERTRVRVMANWDKNGNKQEPKER